MTMALSKLLVRVIRIEYETLAVAVGELGHV